MSWQRRARLSIAVAAVGFAVVLAFAFRDRPQPDAPPPVISTDPEALVESAGGVTFRIDREEERMRIEYDTLFEYPDGRTRMMGVTVTAERGEGRTYVLEAREAQAAGDDSTVHVAGDVRLTSGDGLVVESSEASYQRNEGIVMAAGPVAFSKGRTNGTGIGLHYDLDRENLHILRQAVVQFAGDGGAPGMDIAAGSAQFVRPENVIAFSGSLEARQQGQQLAADEGIAHLAGENESLDRLLLRGHSRITGVSPEPGGLEAMSARDIDLQYRDDGQTIDQATLVQDADIRIAGERAGQGRRISAGRIEFTTTIDGSAPRTLVAERQVRMQLPAPSGGAARTIESRRFEGDGDDTRGITRGRYTGDVVYLERGGERTRTARSLTLDVSLAPGLGDVEEAQFDGSVHFEDGTMQADAAQAIYRVTTDRLELRGGQGSAPPRLVDTRITVEAESIDVDFDGPQIAATGAVKSELRPDPSPGGQASATRRPSMLDDDKPVLVVSDRLDYDGGAGTATYDGNARLSQGDTAIRGGVINLDEKTGDLSAEGSVVTTTILEQVTQGERRRVNSTARATTFNYQESGRQATYEGQAQVGGPQGDMRARLIELYLKPSGNELERVEAYDEVVLLEQGRRTTGNRLTYFSEDERYYVVGTPVLIVDECGRRTTGRTLTFFQHVDRVIVDGNEQMRTRTTGPARCP